MNQPLTRKEWLASLQKDIDEFDWDAAFNDEPKRTWVGLTDEEINGLWEMAQMFKPHKHFYLLVEAKLKEKNE
jgi:hypothetical protein